MSDDCFFNPDACEKDVEEVEQGEEMEEEEEGGDIMPQIAFLMTAGWAAAYSGLQIFSRRLALMSEQTNVDGDTEDALWWFASENTLIAQDEGYDTAYWTLAYTIGSWAMFVMGSAKFLLQALSMLGIMGGTNLMVWHYGMLVGDIVGLVVAVLMFMGRNKAYSITVEETEDGAWTALGGQAVAVVQDIETCLTYGLISETAMHLNLMMNYKGWVEGQIKMLPEEEQAEWEEALMGDKDGDDMDDDMLFRNFFRF